MRDIKAVGHFRYKRFLTWNPIWTSNIKNGYYNALYEHEVKTIFYSSFFI